MRSFVIVKPVSMVTPLVALIRMHIAAAVLRLTTD
jgi:hypothetical protein